MSAGRGSGVCRPPGRFLSFQVSAPGGPASPASPPPASLSVSASLCQRFGLAHAMSLFLQSTVPVRLFVPGGHDPRLRLALGVRVLCSSGVSPVPSFAPRVCGWGSEAPLPQTPESGAEDPGSGTRPAACSPGMSAVIPLASKSRRPSLLQGASSLLLVGPLCVLTGGDAGDGGGCCPAGEKACDLSPGGLVSRCYRFSVPWCLMSVI